MFLTDHAVFILASFLSFSLILGVSAVLFKALEKEADRQLEKVQVSLADLEYCQSLIEHELNDAREADIFRDLLTTFLKLQSSFEVLEHAGEGYSEFSHLLKDHLRSFKQDMKDQKASETTFLRAREIAELCLKSQKLYNGFQESVSTCKGLQRELHSQLQQIHQMIYETEKSFILLDSARIHSQEIRTRIHQFQEPKDHAPMTIPQMASVETFGKTSLRKIKKVA